ncbi:hypothetical protein ACFFRE_08610 [Aciditerrimonas ferrireducens]|uniref:Integral membrane protein n=1 Tax=Aciditerrimonas ferrireducens TaxID=667306 RepID=A0ABV6C3F9_9ACTN
MTGPAAPGTSRPDEPVVPPEPPLPFVLTRRPPPVAELVVASVVCMLAGGIYLASSLPGRPPLAPAIGLVATGAVLTGLALVTLGRARRMDWGRFRQVVRWALVAYAVFAAILVFVFVKDHTSGAVLGVLVATLVVFAVDVPTVLAFTVAWYQQPRDQPAAEGPGGP